jgi:tRNA dimethylallyltransferase
VKEYNCIVVLGPTASGKTRLACNLAYYQHGEIISADSRQVYKHLNIGTGKDLDEYRINEQKIPYHVIDVIEAHEQFYLHQFIKKLETAFVDIINRQKMPVICGGTGLYLDTLRKDFSFTQVKENAILRAELEQLSKEELTTKLFEFPLELRNHVDVNSKKRIIRGLEIADYRTKNNLLELKKEINYQPFYIGISIGSDERKKRISERLKNRLNNGLIEEVEGLLILGVSHQRLETLGLEYKFVSYYLQHKLSKEELFLQLQTAIIQFSKRQMTWFRKMEKEGVKIHWVNVNYEINEVLGMLR